MQCFDNISSFSCQKQVSLFITQKLQGTEEELALIGQKLEYGTRSAGKLHALVSVMELALNHQVKKNEYEEEIHHKKGRT